MRYTQKIKKNTINAQRDNAVDGHCETFFSFFTLLLFLDWATEKTLQICWVRSPNNYLTHGWEKVLEKCHLYRTVSRISIIVFHFRISLARMRQYVFLNLRPRQMKFRHVSDFQVLVPFTSCKNKCGGKTLNSDLYIAM